MFNNIQEDSDGKMKVFTREEIDTLRRVSREQLRQHYRRLKTDYHTIYNTGDILAEAKDEEKTQHPQFARE